MDILITDNGDGGDVVVREPMRESGTPLEIIVKGVYLLPLSVRVVLCGELSLIGEYNSEYDYWLLEGSSEEEGAYIWFLENQEEGRWEFNLTSYSGEEETLLYSALSDSLTLGTPYPTFPKTGWEWVEGGAPSPSFSIVDEVIPPLVRVNDGNYWEGGDFRLITLVLGDTQTWQIMRGETRLFDIISLIPPGGEAMPNPPKVWGGGLTLEYDDFHYETTNADLYQDLGIGTAVYMSLFDAPAWNESFKLLDERIDSIGLLEKAFNEPIIAGTMSKIQRIASSQLKWLLDDGVCSRLLVAVRNPELGLIEIDITATEPNDVQNRYKVMWNREEQKLMSFVRTPTRNSVVLQ
jgi:phage gp46-like protein